MTAVGGKGASGQARRRELLLEEPVGPLLVGLTGPLVLGFLTLSLGAVIDSYFVGQLGPLELAALGFVHPVVLVLANLGMGLGLGAGVVTAHHLGSGADHRAQGLLAHGLALGAALAVALTALGLTIFGPLFRTLGTSAQAWPFVRQYMTIYLLGLPVLFLQRIALGVLRSTGDTRISTVAQLLVAGANALLDPLLIFGWGPVPGLGIRGAAWAWLLAQTLGLAAALVVLRTREGLLAWIRPVPAEIAASWRAVLAVALPATLSRLAFPVSMLFIVGWVATHGTEAVAAFGLAARIENLLMVLVVALSAALLPFVGQNWGAGRFDRVRTGLALCNRFVLIWGAALFLVLLPAAPWLTRFFTSDPQVAAIAATYLRIQSLSFALQGVTAMVGAAFTAAGRPFFSSLLTLVRMFVLYLPFAYLGNEVAGLPGLFAGGCAAFALTGLGSYTWGRAFFAAAHPQRPVPPVVPTPAAPRAAIGVLLVAAGVLTVGCGKAPETPSKVLLIGIDGGSWNLIDPLLETGQLPHLAALRDRGVTAELESVEPVLSPAVWTSIATGRHPKTHGVEFFFANRYSVQVPTLWERFAAAGRRVGLYDYLVTWPPRELPGGFVVPGWLRQDERVWPPDLFERLSLPPYYYEVADIGTAADIIANAERELEEKPRYWNRMAEVMQPEIGAVTFYAVDVLSHRFYATAFPPEAGAAAPEPPVAGVLPRALAGVDRAIGTLVGALGPEDRVIVVSDHGFQAIPEPLERWALDARLIFATSGLDPRFEPMTLFTQWRYVGIKIENGQGEARAEALIARLEALFAGVQTTTGERLFNVQVVREPEKLTANAHPPWMMDVMEAQLPAYAFFFALDAGVIAQVYPDARVRIGSAEIPLDRIAAPHVFTGHHHPTGIFLAAGRGIRHQSQRLRLSVLDVAPLLTYLAGEPLPDDLERPLAEQLLEPAYLERSPPRRVAAAAVPQLPPDGTDPTGAESSEEIRERLRALGYIQ